eukprot:TRINITY_DN66676_c6_g3_i2.p1 TRINITY_DN66676_c6_g3~~TRINITY_DN66676_c6_g3_i2.p1  ORF type:complete len:127 (-),score=31.74 TRINITY_DN66676_c6_g3_i2:231-611(-)
MYSTLGYGGLSGFGAPLDMGYSAIAPAVEQFPVMQYAAPVVYEPAPMPIVQPTVYVEPTPPPPPPPPPQPRVSVVAKSRDPRAQAAANEMLSRFRNVRINNPGDVQRILDTSARVVSRGLPNPVVA